MRREATPLPSDDGFFAARLLTVAEAYRDTPVASLLMSAAVRWVEEQNGPASWPSAGGI